jgi:hypothetical protein
MCLREFLRGDDTDEAAVGGMVLSDVLILIGKHLAGDGWNRG